MLTQVIMGAGFLAVVVTVLTSVTRMTSDINSRLSDVDSRTNLEQSINNIINSPEICGLSLGDQNLSINNQALTQSLVIQSPESGSANVMFKDGTDTGSLTVTKVSFKFTPTPTVVQSQRAPLIQESSRTTSPLGPSVSGSGGTTSSYIFTGDLILSIASRKTGLTFKDLIFPLVVTTTSGAGTYGKIISCMSSQIWQSLSSYQTCPAHHGIVGFADNGRLICREGPPGPPGPAGGAGTDGACTTASGAGAGSVCSPTGWVTR